MIGTLMVVDDRPDLRKLVAEFVAEEGVVVKECADPKEINAFYARERPDWVLMDVHIGEVDGLRATAALVREFPDARVIVTSAYALEEIEEPAANAGATACLSKEDLSELVALLKKLRA